MPGIGPVKRKDCEAALGRGGKLWIPNPHIRILLQGGIEREDWELLR